MAELLDGLAAAGIASAAEERVLALLRRAEAQAKAAAADREAVTRAQLAIADLLAGVGINHRWLGTALQLRLPDGSYAAATDLQGPQGERGPVPSVAIGTVAAGDAPSAVLSPDPNDPLRWILDLVLERGPPGAVDGVGPALAALSTVSPTAGRFPYFVNAESAALAVLSAKARDLLAAASADGMRIVLQAAAAADLLALQGVVDGKAASLSPEFSGVPKAPTAAPGTDTTQIASTAFVAAAVRAITGMAPADLDTLNEIAARIVGGEGTVAALTATVSGKAAKAANLGDLADPAAARSNLQLGSAATRSIEQLAASGALAELIGTKLPNTFGTYASATAALSELPVGRIVIAKIAGQLALLANDGGQPLVLPFVTSTDLDA